MKRFKLWVLTFLLIVSTLAPMTVHAEGEGNIDNGGGGLGEGTDTNFWNTGDEGVRVTVVSASDGSAVTASIDLTNRSPSDIKVHFGKVCKSDYRGGAGLSAKVGGYDYYVPAQSLPKIITTSSGSASLAAIKSYFTDEQVIRSIAGYVGMDYDTLIGGDYKLLLEPIAYVTFEGVRTAFTATEAAMYNQVRGGMLRKKLTSLTHKNLPLAMFLETSDLGYPAWSGAKNQKVSDDEIIGSLGGIFKSIGRGDAGRTNRGGRGEPGAGHESVIIGQGGKENMEKRKKYIAYGSNLNLGQMARRCPTAKVIGKGEIKDHELLFRGHSMSAVATVEPKAGSSVPVLIWEIGPEDERNLDIYEGYPRLYGKVDLEVQTEEGCESIMAYTMNEGHEIGKPSSYYLETITAGYLDAGFDVNRLLESVTHCKEVMEKRFEKEGMEEQTWNQQLLQ